MEIELPDGTVLEAPDGADTRKVVAGYKAHLSTPKSGIENGKPGLTESPTSLNNLIGAALEPMASMGTGALAQILSGLGGIATGGNANVVRKIQQKLTYQPKTTGGENAMKAFGAIPDVLQKIVPALVESGYRDPEMASFGDETVGTVNPAIATALDTAVQGAPQILGARGAAKAPRIVPPKTVNPEVAALAKEGVTMTPGARKGGVLNTAEQKLSSVPFAGDFVARARGKSIEQWNTARLNEAVSDAGGTPVPKGRTGRDALFHVEQQMKRRYGEVLNKMSLRNDPQLTNALSQAKKYPGLDAKSVKTVAQVINNEVTGKLTGKSMGEELKEIQETLRTEADGYRSGDYQSRKIAGALDRARKSFLDALKRQNPKLAPELEGVDKGYAKFQTAALASRYGKKSGGVYSPAQSLRAIERRDKSKNKMRFATGKAHGQKGAESAEKILGNTVPDSGTPARYALMEAILGGGGALAAHPIAGGAAALAPLLYSQPVLKALQRAALSGKTPVGSAGAAALPVGASEDEALKQLGAVP